MSTTTPRWSLDGRVALVAGGGGGIGSAVCAALKAAGATVVAADRPDQDGPAGVESAACDLTDSAAVSALVEGVVTRHGRLDAVVHAAGITRDGTLSRLTDEAWRDVMAANVDSAFYLLRAAGRAMRDTGGAIVVVSSINGERGKAGQANYAASKGALNALAKTAAREFGRHGVRVNVVAPGWIETSMTASLPAELRERARSESALGRLGLPEDVASVVLFLCTEASRHVTGQVLRVDGGQLIG